MIKKTKKNYKEIDFITFGIFLTRYERILKTCAYSQLVYISNMLSKEIKRRKGEYKND